MRSIGEPCILGRMFGRGKVRCSKHDNLQLQPDSYCIYLRVSCSTYKTPMPKNRVHIWSKIIDPCISHRLFLGLVLDAEVTISLVIIVEFVITAASSTWYTRSEFRSWIFWRLEKNSLFYDPIISRPRTFWARFHRKF